MHCIIVTLQYCAGNFHEGNFVCINNYRLVPRRGESAKFSYISKLVDLKWNSLNPILNHHQVNILWLFITAPKTPLRGSGWKLLELSLVWAFLDQNKSIATANQSLVNITRRQWELKLSKARENAIDQVTVSFGLAPDWLRQRREIPRSITEQSS